MTQHKKQFFCGRGQDSGFTLIELLVVIAIIAILIAMLVPAVQKVREASSRTRCQNNIKQLALGCHSYYDARSQFPYGRRYDYWDTYTWTQQALPFIEQASVQNNYYTLFTTGVVPSYPGANGPIGDEPRLREARHALIPVFNCPSDPSGDHNGNELNTTAYGMYRGNYRACAASGDMYGNATDGTTGPWGIGVFMTRSGQSDDPGATIPTRGVTMKMIVDGTSNTLLISEGLTPTVSGWGGPLGAHIYGNMGGALFSASLSPNASAADQLVGPCPADQGDTSYKAPCVRIANNAWFAPSATGAQAAARSFHHGGVNAALADGSVRFFANTIPQNIWRAMGTIRGDESVNIDAY